MNSENCRWLTLACLMLSTAHAGDFNKHSATLSMQGDENDNRQWLGKVALPLGEHAWVQGSVGRSDLAAAGANDSKIVGAAFGVGGKDVSAAVELVQRKSDARFEQQTWNGTLDWHGMRVGLGADVSIRSATSVSSSTTQTGGVFTTPVTTTFKESADGQGFGVHGDLALTTRFIVSAGAMRYRYDFDVESNTGTNTALGSLLGTNVATPGAWRDQAFVDRTYRVGATYLLQSAAMSARYFRDRIAHSDTTFSTVELQAEFRVADHWALSPTLGYSQGGALGNVAYGGMSLRFDW